VGYGADHALAIVQHNEHLLAAQMGGDAAQRIIVQHGHVQQGRHSRGYLLGVVSAGQVDQAGSLRVAVTDVLGNGERDGALADTAGTDDCDQPVEQVVRRTGHMSSCRARNLHRVEAVA
jgi:hypothetical protein